MDNTTSKERATHYGERERCSREHSIRCNGIQEITSNIMQLTTNTIRNMVRYITSNITTNIMR